MTYIVDFVQTVPLMELLVIKTDFLWRLVMIFGGLAGFCFLMIFYFRNRMLVKGHNVISRKKELGPMIRNFLLEQADSVPEKDSDSLWMKMEIRQLLRSETDRKAISEIMLEVQREARPEMRLRISELYQFFELHDHPLSQLESRNWDKVSRAIAELTEMQVVQAYDAIKEHSRSKNSIIRKQAQLATVRLKEEGIQYVLDTALFPISQWQQVKIMEILTSKTGFALPSFRNWLISENQDVVLFALRLIRVFKQEDAKQALLMFLHHRSERIQIAALECISEFRYTPAGKTLQSCFEKATAEMKIHILNTLESIGTVLEIPWLEEKAVSDDSFLVRSKARMVLSALRAETALTENEIQEEFEFQSSTPEAEDSEITEETPLQELTEPDAVADLFTSEPYLINTLSPDFSTVLTTPRPGDLKTEKDHFLTGYLSETPEALPLEAWNEEYESVFEDCIIEELLDILMPDTETKHPEKSPDGFLPLIVDQIKSPSDMTPGKITPEWIRQLEVEIEALSGSTGYFGILRDLLLEELRETEQVLETEFIPVGEGGPPSDFDQPVNLEGEGPPMDLFPEFAVSSQEIHQAREAMESNSEHPQRDSELQCFSIFEEFFRSYDTESKLILMDEIHVVGGAKELKFLQGLFSDSDPRIQKHARKSHALLSKRLEAEGKALPNQELTCLWLPEENTPESNEKAHEGLDSDSEYFSFSPDTDRGFPVGDVAKEALHSKSEDGYYRLLNQIKGTKNDTDAE